MTSGERVASSGFGQFMASGAGRLLRIVAGVALIAWGISMDSTGGYILAAVGVIPLLAGVFGICLITGLIGGLWTGSSVKACAARR